MARRRFFVRAVHNGRAELEGDGAEHLRRVLRAERGQRYEISDNESVYLAEVSGFGKGRVEFRVLEKIEAEPPPLRLGLLVSLIKFDRLEWLLEKATELGVESITLVEAERSDRGLDTAARKRLERWRRILLESSQQSRRAKLPELFGPVPFAQAVATAGSWRYLLEEQDGARPLVAALPENRGREDSVYLLAGPEGGLTDAERATTRESGWQPVSLGPLILRTETAVIAALAVLTNAWLAAMAYNGSR